MTSSTFVSLVDAAFVISLSKLQLLPHCSRIFAFRDFYSKEKPETTQVSSKNKKQRYKDSNLEMTESESVALPFGDSAKMNIVNYNRIKRNVKHKIHTGDTLDRHHSTQQHSGIEHDHKP